jgi:hypothetical protein
LCWNEKSGKLYCDFFAIFLTPLKFVILFQPDLQSIADSTKKRVDVILHENKLQASVLSFLAVITILKDVSNATSRFKWHIYSMSGTNLLCAVRYFDNIICQVRVI